MLEKWLSRSRYLVSMAVFGCFVLATLLFVYGALHSVDLVFETVNGYTTGKKLAIAAIELVDIFLLATVFYIIALGFYELFINDQVPVPAWLEIHTLDDLKKKLLGIVITVLAVLFLGQAVAWSGSPEFLNYGASIALVIGSLTFYLRQK